MRFTYMLRAVAAFMAAGVSVSEADPLPFNNGRYVINLELCAVKQDKLVELYGDTVARMTRNIDGSHLDNGYELFCEIEGVRRLRNNISFDAYCESEGDRQKIRGSYLFISQNEFMIGKNKFTRCVSVAAEKTYGDGLSATTSEIISLWDSANVDCRGGLPSDPEMAAACASRETYHSMLRGRDWCRGQEGQAEYQMKWHPCGYGSIRD